MDILVTPRLTLRPPLEVDADNVRELIAKEPHLADKLPRVMIALIGSDDLASDHKLPPDQLLVVIREKLIGWISFHEAEATAFAAGSTVLQSEALAAALTYFARNTTRFAPIASHQLQSAQFAA